MTPQLIYRLYPVEQHKRRPPYHSKIRSLRSAAQSLVLAGGERLHLLVDSDALPEEYAAVIPARLDVTIELLGGLGNVGSYRRQMELARSFPPDDLVYLSEDDYLYRPEAFSALVAAAAELPHVDYFSLYDHPDRYTRDDDARLRGGKQLWVAGSQHWRWVESACMTYGARVHTLLADAALHDRFATRGDYPDDRLMWRRLQGVGPGKWGAPRRRLASAVPSLATHMDEEFLAPVIDWRAVADIVDCG